MPNSNSRRKEEFLPKNADIEMVSQKDIGNFSKPKYHHSELTHNNSSGSNSVPNHSP